MKCQSNTQKDILLILMNLLKKIDMKIEGRQVEKTINFNRSRERKESGVNMIKLNNINV